MIITKFPERRFGTAIEFDYGCMNVRANFNRYGGLNEIGELFVNAGKPDSAAHYMGQEAAIIFSIARKYGAPVDEIRSALPMLSNGSPAGPIGRALKLAGEG